MKTLNRIIAILVLLLITAVVIYFIRKDMEKPCPPEGYSLVSNATIDSLKLLADSTKIDTIWISVPGPAHSEEHEPKTIDEPPARVSSDSLITPFYKVYLKTWIMNNAVLRNEWYWTEPEQRTLRITEYKPVFYPVTIKEPCVVKPHLYGGTQVMFPFGSAVGVKYEKNGFMYGISAGTIMQKPYIQVEFYMRIF